MMPNRVPSDITPEILAFCRQLDPTRAPLWVPVATLARRHCRPRSHHSEGPCRAPTAAGSSSAGPLWEYPGLVPRGRVPPPLELGPGRADRGHPRTRRRAAAPHPVPARRHPRLPRRRYPQPVPRRSRPAPTSFPSSSTPNSRPPPGRNPAPRPARHLPGRQPRPQRPLPLWQRPEIQEMLRVGRS